MTAAKKLDPTTPRERPILFSAPMVRAILSGAKTQTRRAVKPQPEVSDAHAKILPAAWEAGFIDVRCPYGAPGDRLYVREHWRTIAEEDDLSPKEVGAKAIDAGWTTPWAPIVYLADGTRRDWTTGFEPGRFRHGRFMPRWASRITLEITDVRVERLNDISEADAQAEGLSAITKDGSLVKYGIPDRDGLPGTDNDGWPWTDWNADPRKAFAHLWRSINGAESWDANPFVWVVEFRRVSP